MDGLVLYAPSREVSWFASGCGENSAPDAPPVETYTLLTTSANRALAAIHAFLKFPNQTVTLIEQRGKATLPALMTNRQATLDMLAEIDPVLAERVRARSESLGGGPEPGLTQGEFALTERSGVERTEDVLDDLDRRFAAHRHFEFMPLPHSLC